MKDPIASVMQDGHASLQDSDASFRIIAKDIEYACSKLFVSKAYLAILDAIGFYHYVDHPMFDEFLYFIQKFALDNKDLMEIGDYSIPFGGTNLIIFKISAKAFIAFHAPKGPVGQLLAFKAIMGNWASKIDDLIGDLEEIPEMTEEIEGKKSTKQKSDLKQVPLLIKPLTGKEKFPLEEAAVIRYCDGTYSIEEICRATKYPLLKVDLIIRKYQKKNWIKIMRVL